MTAPDPGAPASPAPDDRRLAALRAASDAVTARTDGPDGTGDPVDPAGPTEEADRFEALHDALVDVLAAAETGDPDQPRPGGPSAGGRA